MVTAVIFGSFHQEKNKGHFKTSRVDKNCDSLKASIHVI